MADLRSALEYSAKNPTSDFARQLKLHIQSGAADQEATAAGINLTPFGRPAPVQQPVITPDKSAVGDVAAVYGNEISTSKEELGKAVTEGAERFNAAPNLEAGSHTPVLEAVKKTADKTAALVGTGRDVALAALRAIFAPITAGTEVAIDRAGDNEALQKFAAGNSDALDAANKLQETYAEFAKHHPELSKNLNLALALTGGEEGSALAGNLAKKGVDVSLKTGEKVLETAVKGTETLADTAAKTGERILPGARAAGTTIWDTVTTPFKNAGRNISDLFADKKAKGELLAEKGEKAVRLLEEAGSPEFVNVVDRTKSIEDLSAKRDMLDIAEQRMKGKASDKLPRQVVADKYIVPRVETLRTRLEELGKKIGEAKVDKTRVDTTDLVDTLIEAARKDGVIVRRGSNIDLKGLGEVPISKTHGFTFSKAPGVSGIDKSRINTVKGMFEGFRADTKGRFSNTRSQLAQTRKNLSDLTSRSDSAKEVVSPGGSIDTGRRLIAQKIGDDYYQATKDYSNISRVLEQLDPDLKVRLSEDAVGELRSMKFGDMARRLLSNNATQAKAAFRSLDELFAKEAARMGKKVPEQDLADLVDFAGAVEEGFGITPRNSFFGQVSGGVSDALGKVATGGGGFGERVLNFLTKPVRDDKRTLEAMKSYLEEAIAKRSK